MKTKILLSLVASGLVTGSAHLAAQAVDFSSLPGSVQDTINAQRGPAGIVSIQRVDRFGPPLYQVRLNQAGPDNTFYVTDTGTLVNPSDVLVSQSVPTVTRDIAFNSLPASVQGTIRAQLGDVPVSNVEMVNANGQSCYLVPSRIEDRMVDMWIDPSGHLLALSPPRVLLSGGIRINPDELPIAVQDPERHAGRHIPLRIAQDGALVRDRVNDFYLSQLSPVPAPVGVGQAPTWQHGVGASVIP